MAILAALGLLDAQCVFRAIVTGHFGNVTGRFG